MQIYKNNIKEHEFDICSILTQLAYHMHPKISEYIQNGNLKAYIDTESAIIEFSIRLKMIRF